MEGIGRLAGGVAHDFNNLLTAILGYARLVLDELPADSPLRGDVEEIQRAGDRAARLTKQLLAFGRKQIVQIRPTDLNRVVLNMDQILRRTLGEDIELVTMVSDELGSIDADAGLIEQVIMNLAVNARDAMPRGGKLTILTERVALDAAYAETHVGVKPGDYIVLVVRDTGSGMTPEVREHVFEPFFTTKEKGKGSGLGLSTVYGITNQLRGHIELVTEAGRGAEFRIYFPRIGAEVVPEAVPRSTPAVRTGKETILVVEDENTVRQLAVRYLESFGYSTVQARNGEEALRVYQRSEKKIDLVLSDIVMPNMGGPELADQLRAIPQDVRVVYMTGFAEDLPAERARASDGATTVLKPFTREALAQAVRETLDGADRRGY
jgi:CheY-like chemotaxis protein